MNIDADGYLADHEAWTPGLAEQLAKSLTIDLSAEHWVVITSAREFYQAHQLSPAMRPLINRLKNSDCPDLANSIRLMQLFPATPDRPTGESPAKRVALIAGLPKPTNCL